jgi:hypothetical protein
MILPLIGDLQYTPLPLHIPYTSSLILDMMSRVQSIGLPKLALNFGYLADVFVASVLASGRDFYRIEAVGDRYRDTSIKDCTRMKRTKSHPSEQNLILLVLERLLIHEMPASNNQEGIRCFPLCEGKQNRTSTVS